MFLPRLCIVVDDNPDSPSPGKKWLRNLYRVHQRLCMAFPSEQRKLDDPEFLKPFKPENFGEKQVHVKRKEKSGFLFRIDPVKRGRVAILVQSALKPNWDYAFHNANYFLVTKPETKEFNPVFVTNQVLQFRLMANPTRKIDTKSGPDGKRRNGKRVPVPSDQLANWLMSRAEAGGFAVGKDSIIIQPGYIYVNKPWNGKPCPQCGSRKMKQEEKAEGTVMVCQSKACGHEVKLFRHRLRSVRYDGILTVANHIRLKETLTRGIGPAKAFGFGLLSVAPVKRKLPGTEQQ